MLRRENWLDLGTVCILVGRWLHSGMFYVCIAYCWFMLRAAGKMEIVASVLSPPKLQEAVKPRARPPE